MTSPLGGARSIQLSYGADRSIIRQSRARMPGPAPLGGRRCPPSDGEAAVVPGQGACRAGRAAGVGRTAILRLVERRRSYSGRVQVLHACEAAGTAQTALIGGKTAKKTGPDQIQSEQRRGSLSSVT